MPRFSFWTHPLVWCLLWMLLHVAARVAVSPALELDEAEQALWSQALSWGYGSQPPLYTWLQAGWFALLGPGVLALSSLKFMLLGRTLVLVWLALGLRVWANGQRGAPDELNEPIAALAGALRAAGYDGRSPIVAGDAVLAGQLRLQFVQAPVTVCPLSAGTCPPALERTPGPGWLQVARGTPVPPPGWWRAPAAPLPPSPVALALPYHYGAEGQAPMRYQFLWQPAQAPRAAPPPVPQNPRPSP